MTKDQIYRCNLYVEDGYWLYYKIRGITDKYIFYSKASLYTDENDVNDIPTRWYGEEHSKGDVSRIKREIFETWVNEYFELVE